METESLSYLKTKLCRRLTKLEADRQTSTAKFQETYDYLFAKLESHFVDVVKKTSEKIEREWASWKSATKRPVPDLPRHAHPRHQYLTLPNSGQYIQSILNEAAQKSRRTLLAASGQHEAPKFEFSSAATRQARVFALKYFKLAEIESQINSVVMGGDNSAGSETQCIRAATLIKAYIDQVADAYDSNPELNSGMLLSLMELWVYLDKNCIKAIELLGEYSPMFPTNIRKIARSRNLQVVKLTLSSLVDVLQLPTLRDLTRLQNVRHYLEARHNNCHTHMSIFTDPVKGCFAERYFDSDSGEELQELYEEIMSSAEVDRQLKEEEWEKKCLEFEKLTKSISESSCIFVDNEYGRVHAQHCKKCYLEVGILRAISPHFRLF